MIEGEFVSPLVDGLTKLIKSEGYSSLKAIYDAEEKIIFRDLINAKTTEDLWKLVGRAKELNKLRELPENTIDRFINDKNKRGENEG